MRTLFCFVLLAALGRAQDEPNPKTLLPQPVIDALVNEVSGSVAMQHILELASYERDRPAEEYRTLYRESAYIEKMARQYGLEDVHIERFKLPGMTWDGELGELWLLDPQRKRLLISYRDVPASLAPGSRTSEATAELVYVGRGEDKKDYADKNVAGKIVLASGSTGAVHNLAVREFGAAGVVSFANPTGKPIDRPDQVAWNGLSRGFGPGAANQKTTFGFNISHRLGMELVELLERRQTLTVLARVRATEYEADMQVPTAVIKGTGASGQEVAVAGHLFEGIAKQGAMDDASGCAAVLEIGRAWRKLIDDGVLPRPRRTVRFLWVPEIQGTRAYLNRFPDQAKRMVAAISMDMVGEDVTKNRNSLHLMRTPYSVNSFLNEVTQQFFEFVGDTNREKVQNRRIAYAYRYPILDPQGSLDPFYYNIDKHYGASDHSVFLSSGVPAVLFNNWPDIAYHTNEDRSSNGDPTQLKRAAFIGLASLAAIANADAAGALRIAELAAGNGAARAGIELRLALQMVGEKGSYKEAANLVRQAYARESDAIRSAAVLAEDAAAAAKIEELARSFAETGQAADLQRLAVYAKAVGVDTSTAATPEETAASRLVPVRKRPAPSGFGGGPGGGERGGQRDPAEASRAQYNAMEMRGFADGKRSVLDIRNAVSAEYGPLDLAKVMEFFRGLEKTGEFELTQRGP
jgi:hypothetical protein